MKTYLSKKASSVSPYTAGEQPKDKKYIKLNTNENPYPPSPKAKAEYDSFAFSDLKLYPDPFAKKLREAIAGAEGVDAENVFCGNGSDEILALCFPAFFDADGKGAAFADITYSFYPVFCDFFGIKKNIVPLEDDFTLSFEKLKGTAAQGVLIANPNAPTGIGIPLPELEAFIAASDRIVILDEAYMPFFGQTAVPLTKKYDNVLVVKTFSKGYSLAGIRCGYAIGCRALIEGLERMRDCFNSYPVDSVCQAVCAAAISDTEYYREKNALVVSERARLSIELEKSGFEVLPSSSNFVFASHHKKSGKEIYEVLKERGVLVRWFNKPKIDSFVRITVGSKEENDGLLNALSDILRF